jgi:hypothetical protein
LAASIRNKILPMGLFNFGKKKETESKQSEIRNYENVDMTSFRKEYLWGITQGNPMRHSDNKNDFYKLISSLTGEKGSITIGASFHPYQIIDKSGNDIWETVFSVIKANNYCDFNELITKKYFFHMNPPGAQAFPITMWTDDRLFHEINPEFGQYVPFFIPYLTYNDGVEPLWLSKLHEGIETVGNAHEFINSVNQASRFLMPEPTFIIGFDEFDKNNQRVLIDHYVDFLERNINKQ